MQEYIRLHLRVLPQPWTYSPIILIGEWAKLYDLCKCNFDIWCLIVGKKANMVVSVNISYYNRRRDRHHYTRVDLVRSSMSAIVTKNSASRACAEVWPRPRVTLPAPYDVSRCPTKSCSKMGDLSDADFISDALHFWAPGLSMILAHRCTTRAGQLDRNHTEAK